MNKIINEIKLDFDDVLIKPKRSKLNSRSEVSITRSFKFLNSNVANGYGEKFVNSTKYIRSLYPDTIIIAGNVVTPEMVEELLLRGGVDIVKVGIGSGGVCTTRLKTGGYFLLYKNAKILYQVWADKVYHRFYRSYRCYLSCSKSV